MVSNLNLKKSWNPQLYKNREEVWKREKEVFDEHKKKQAQAAKENDINEQNELLALATKSTESSQEGKKTRWMYKSDDSALKEFENSTNEDIMLGTKSLSESMKSRNSESKLSGVAQVTKGLERKELLKPKPEEILSKDDPMYAIKLQQLKQKNIKERERDHKRTKTEYSKKKKSNRNRGNSSRDKEDRYLGRSHKTTENDGRKTSRPYNARDIDPDRMGFNYRDRK